jgi:DNA mismatch repair protein MutS
MGSLINVLQNGRMHCDLRHFRAPNFYEPERYMGIDSFSRRNLELCETLRSKDTRGSLFWAVDRTRTSAGARMLRGWLEKPLVSCVAIRTRQDAVEALTNEAIRRGELRDLLQETVDIDRLATK